MPLLNKEKHGDGFSIGNIIHSERIRQGYKSPTQFCKEIERVTGFSMPLDTLQRIESGKQQPKVEQYAAIALTLGKLQDVMLRDALSSDMISCAMDAALTEFKERNPDAVIVKRVYLRNENHIQINLSDGTAVSIDPLDRTRSVAYNPTTDEWGEL